jgi:UDP-glucose 4-epimerase
LHFDLIAGHFPVGEHLYIPLGELLFHHGSEGTTAYFCVMEKMVVLVTGGAGYIGSHTVVALHEAGFSPLIVDNFANSNPSALDGIAEIVGEPVPFVKADCGDFAAMMKLFKEQASSGQPIGGVIHFAAYKAVGESVEKPLDYFENNIGSTANLLRVMEANGVGNLVFSSSCTVYGEPDAIPVDESAPIKVAESPYGYTKQACERLITDVAKARPEMAVALLRYFNPIGAHPTAAIGELPLGRPNNLIPFLTQATAGKREPLTVFGNDYPTADGTCIRDYIHVVDLADAHVAAMNWLLQATRTENRNMPLLEAFNLGTGTGSSVKEVLDTFEAVNDIAVPFQFGPRRPGDVVAIYAEADKARDMLGWTAERSLGDALRDAWNWEKKLGS